MTTTIEDDGLRTIDTDEIAAILFAQRQTPYVWADAIGAPAESDEGTLVSICRDDAAAVLAALRSSPAVDGVGEPAYWAVHTADYKMHVGLWSDEATARRIAAEYTMSGAVVTPLFTAPPAPTSSDRASVDAASVLRELARNETNEADAKALRYAANRLNSFDALKAEAALSPRSS